MRAARRADSAIMKLIDKYLLRQFLVPLGCCLAAFSMIFVIADLFDHLSDFIVAGTPIFQVVRYYAYLLPALLVFIAPISLLLGVLYTLWRLSRNNELTAMRSCGISLHRCIVPFLVVGLVFSVLVTVFQETVAPWSSYWAAQFIERLGSPDKQASRYANNLSFKSDAFNRIWSVRKFDLETYAMEGISVVVQESDGGVSIIHAEEGKYFDGQWWFYNVTTQKRDARNNPIGPVASQLIMEMSEFAEKPADFVNVVKNPIFFSARESWEFLKTHEQLSSRTRARFLVDMHVRLAMPWTCLIVILFGIPCGVHTGRKGPFAGIVAALLSFFGFYVLMTICQWLGKEQFIGPFWSAWLPNLVFLATGICLMIRAR